MKILYLPVEIYKREFAERLYMGLIAVSRGYCVVIGEANNRVFKIAKSGVLFHKDHANWSDDFLRSAKLRGLKTCALDEEGLIIGDVNLYKRARVSMWALNNLDAVFCWGIYQQKVIAEVSSSSRTIVVGSPKFDVGKLYANDRDIVDSQGVIRILINTRFTYNNGVYGDYDIDNLIHLGVIDSYDDIEYYKRLVTSEVRIFDEFCKLIELLGSLDTVRVTIRPHPLERDGKYNELSSKFKNVTVDRIKDLREQIVECDVVVHDGCTTAIEARSLGKPVLGLRPSGLNPVYDGFSNNFSFNFTSAQDLFSYISKSPDFQSDCPCIDEFASGYISNWGPHKNATYEIINSIDQFADSFHAEPNYGFWNHVELKNVIYSIATWNRFIESVLALFFRSHYRGFINRRNIALNKFGKLTLGEINAMIQKYAKADKNITSVDQIGLKLIGPRVLVLQKIDS
jgi:surface carbohydrate biosynthesis protein